jgi:vacuolar-type H+-ATPase subunit I/STV1
MKIIFVGFVLIAIGLLVRRYPNLLAGYSQLSSRDREGAVSNGLPAFASIAIVSMGLLFIAGYILSVWLDMPALASQIVVAVSLVGAIGIVVFGKILVNRRTK